MSARGFDGSVSCCYCGKSISPRISWRRVQGFERRRSAGGTNAVALRETLDVWACDVCVNRHRRGVANQETLI